MLKALPAGRWPLRPGARTAAHDLARVVSSPFDELRSQNLELLATLEELRARQEELGRLNEELAETNRGVMAMYSQLSVELEETNRGVVALYAELDEAEYSCTTRAKPSQAFSPASATSCAAR